MSDITSLAPSVIASRRHSRGTSRDASRVADGAASPSPRPTRRYRWVAVSAALAVSLAACGGDDDGGVSATGSSDEAAGAGVSAMLALLPPAEPTADSPLMVAYGDLATATELAGADRPDGADDVEGYVDWVMTINSLDGDVAVLLPQTAQPRDPEELADVADELGFSVVDVDRFVELQMPPDTLAVVVGDVGSGDLDDALGDAVEGIHSAGEGDDFQISPDTRTAARPFGAPLRLAARDGAVAVGPSTPLMQAWLAGAPTLADDAVLSSLAAELDAAAVYTATLVRRSAAVSGPNPFDAVGVGLAFDDDGPSGVVVYHYADDATASAAVASVESILAGDSDRSGGPWSELFPSWEVSAAGPTVTVRLRIADGRAMALWNALYANDTLFAAEG